MMTQPIVVIGETGADGVTSATLECVEEARELASSLGTAVHVQIAGHRLDGLAADLTAHGADHVTLVEHEALAQFSADAWLAALAPVLRAAKPAVTLAPDSGYGRSWLPRLSARWRIPLATSCIRVKITEDGYPEVYRSSHGGKLHERLIWARGSTIIVMLADGVRGAGAPSPERRADVRVVCPELDARTFRDRTLRTFPPDPHDVDLGEAERIVAGGLGVGGAEGMALLQKLADALNASLGGTRVAADRGWLPADRFIGTTGKIVAPKLYLALGVSGAGQHVAGIGASELIVAVNTDRTAPVFKIVDLGIVGDLHTILPILLEKLKAHAQSRRESGAGASSRRTPALKVMA